MEKKRNEQLLPIGNLKGGYEIVSSNFDGNDLVINIVSTRDEKDEVTFAFPDVLAYRNTLECYRLSDVDVNVSKGEIISALYEVKITLAVRHRLTLTFVTLGYAVWLVQEYACMIR